MPPDFAAIARQIEANEALIVERAASATLELANKEAWAAIMASPGIKGSVGASRIAKRVWKARRKLLERIP